MEAKKIYESGKLHGVYRCGKREELVNKIPRIDKEGIQKILDKDEIMMLPDYACLVIINKAGQCIDKKKWY